MRHLVMNVKPRYCSSLFWVWLLTDLTAKGCHLEMRTLVPRSNPVGLDGTAASQFHTRTELIQTMLNVFFFK